jgi:hypothetical protein
MPKIETFENKLTVIREELERMLNTEQARLHELNAKICAAVAGKSMFNLGSSVDTSALEVASGSMDVIMLRGARSFIFARYLDGLRQNQETNTSAQGIYEHLERTATRELAIGASSLTSCSSSWVTNQRKNADLTALGDVVRLFVDIAAAEA